MMATSYPQSPHSHPMFSQRPPHVVGTSDPQATLATIEGMNEPVNATTPSVSAVPDAARKPISRTLRYQVLRRDGHTCRYCGATAPDVPLTVDHVVPRALGGSDDPANLITACRDCNAGKAATPADASMVADVEATAFAFARALEIAATQRRSDRVAMDAILGDFYAAWCTYFDENKWNDHWLDTGWSASVTRFIERGLNLGDLKAAIYATLDASIANGKLFRYFCGCCWNEIRARDVVAKHIMDEDR